MRLEALVTCLDFEEWQNENEPNTLINLIGVFQRLGQVPDNFVAYVELWLEDLDVTDGVTLSVRCRKPGLRGQSAIWFESIEYLIPVGAGPGRAQIPIVLENVGAPSGRSIVQVLVNDRVEGEHLVDFVA